jgi:zinc protease
VQADEKLLNIQEVKSNKGITAWLVEDHSLPIIAVKFSFKGAGAVQNLAEKQGVARLLSNTLDEGAGDLTSEEFQKILNDNSITLSFNSGRDNFGGQLKTLSRHKEKAFELLRLSLTQPRFDEDPVERMRQDNIARIRSSVGNPDWIAARIFNDKAFENHPYALNSGGTLTTLQNITADDLRTHLKDYLTQDRLHIGVMGDITVKELEILLDEVFGELPKTGEVSTVKDLELQNQNQTFIYEKDIPQTILTLSMPSIDRNDPEYYAAQVMNYIFGGGGFGSRLMEEAREKRGLTYGIYSSLVNQDHVNYLNIGTSTKNASVAEMKQIIQQQVEDIKTNGVTDQELEDAKSYLVGSLPTALSSTDKIAGILLTLQMNERDINYLDQYANNINTVTQDDIKRIANRILDIDQAITIMVGQPENVENTVEVKELNNIE